jgi:pheganomycin biosynthesis PGM1-like protein/pre ATP-grasp domain-containing protein
VFGAPDPVATADLDHVRIPLPEEELQAQFEALQRKLVPQWRVIEEEFTDEPYGIVVVPSLSGIDLPLDSTKRQAYEERYLFLLFLLRQPRATLVYVTSEPIQPSVIDYYLGLLPGVVIGHARRRLHLVSPHDGGPPPLSAKLLERPRLLDEIRALAGDPDRAHLVPYNTTRLERDLALRLGLPMYGADPKFASLGTKSGARALFAEAGVPHPDGREGLRSVDDVVDAVLELLVARPGIESVVLKHDEGVSGLGNAVLDLRGLEGASRPRIEERLSDLRPEDARSNAEQFLERLAGGGIIEELVVGAEIRSPSVQMRATPLGKVEQLSTHDQMLGGASGQLFLGSVFPASEAYARQIADEALKVGELLTERGVIGRFAVDFLTARTDERWKPYAIELNLRKGGTTHPYLTLQFLTDGQYDTEQARFVTPTGDAKFFVSTDRLESDAYRVLQPDDIFDLAVRTGLHFDHTTKKGTVFHMMTALGRHGIIGLTAVGDSHEEARSLFEGTRDALDREARAGARQRDLPAVDSALVTA